MALPLAIQCLNAIGPILCLRRSLSNSAAERKNVTKIILFILGDVLEGFKKEDGSPQQFQICETRRWRVSQAVLSTASTSIIVCLVCLASGCGST